MTDQSMTVIHAEGELVLSTGEVTAVPAPLEGESIHAFSDRLKHLDRKAIAKACKSENHPRSACWGEVDDCPVCGVPHCYADGAADEVSEAEGFGNICDTCWCEVNLSTPGAAA